MEKFGRYALALVVLASILVIVFVGPCSAPGPAGTATSQPVAQPVTKVFTTAELSKYNGLNGQPAYVGADGYVYDVSRSPLWAGGKHSMCHLDSTSGQDLTSVLNQAPTSMRALLQKFPVVGRLQ